MYAIIYWANDDEDIFFKANNNGSVYLYDKLENAEQDSQEFEIEKGFDTRVVLLDKIK